MRRSAWVLAAILAGSWWTAVQGQTTEPSTQPSYHAWWNDRFPRQRPLRDAKKLPKIKAVGNHFVDPDGKTILFRGVATSDPDKLDHQGHWNLEYFQHIKDLGTTLVRIPVHPIAWRQRGADEYLPLLDQGVQWCTDLDMHVIIDWHTIGNLKTELFQDPMYDTTQKETFGFWRTIARHYNGNNTIAFYELFNEPTTFRGQLGACSWADWKTICEQEIGLIRAYDPNTIVLVGGFDWAYDLTPVHEQPINADNIGYTVHPYANKRPQPWEPKWEEDFGFVASTYPVIATEFGFGLRGSQTVTDDAYGNRITRYLESKGISWVAWCFDPQWGPQLLRNWNFDLTGSGEFFKMAMHREIGTKAGTQPSAGAN